MAYYANINGKNVEISEEENEQYKLLAASVPPPGISTNAQIEQLFQQQLDIAEAITQLYESSVISNG